MSPGPKLNAYEHNAQHVNDCHSCNWLDHLVWWGSWHSLVCMTVYSRLRQMQNLCDVNPPTNILHHCLPKRMSDLECPGPCILHFLPGYLINLRPEMLFSSPSSIYSSPLSAYIRLTRSACVHDRACGGGSNSRFPKTGLTIVNYGGPEGTSLHNLFIALHRFWLVI